MWVLLPMRPSMSKYAVIGMGAKAAVSVADLDVEGADAGSSRAPMQLTAALKTWTG